MTAALEGGEWSAARPNRTLPPGKTRYPFYRRMGGPPGPNWTGRKSRPHRDSIPDRSSRSSVAIPTELPGPHPKIRTCVLWVHKGVEYMFCRRFFVIYEFNRTQVYKSRNASRFIFGGNPVVNPIGHQILKLRFIVTLFNSK